MADIPMRHHLSNYKNLIDWAIRTHAQNDTLPEQKDDFLRQIDEKLSTKYERKHIDNWLSARAATPKRVRELIIDELLEAEVEYEFSDLGKQLRRLVKT